jgi:hypothetical protein
MLFMVPLSWASLTTGTIKAPKIKMTDEVTGSYQILGETTRIVRPLLSGEILD